MKNTRFMEVMFSAVENKDEELTNQVAKDIEDAASVEGGVVDTDEVKYENVGNGKVNITDKETGEVTVAEKASDEDGTYDLYPAEITEQIEVLQSQVTEVSKANTEIVEQIEHISGITQEVTASADVTLSDCTKNKDSISKVMQVMRDLADEADTLKNKNN